MRIDDIVGADNIVTIRYIGTTKNSLGGIDKLSTIDERRVLDYISVQYVGAIFYIH